MNSEQQYIDLYTQAREIIASHAPEAMNAVRDKAFEDFKAQGFPSRKVERYKYTDMQKLFEPDYGVNLNRLKIPVDPYEAFRCDVPNLSTCLYFMVNDSFYCGVRSAEREGKLPNSIPKLPEGVIVGSMQELFSLHTPHSTLLEKYYAKLAKTSDDAVTALNTMLAQDGLLVYVPKNIKVDRAIQVINILKATPSNAQRLVPDLMVNRRVLIILEEGAEIKMLFCDHAADDKNFLATQVIEAYVGENASLDLYCLEETHHKNVRISNVYIDQQRDSRVNHNVITLHNGITKAVGAFAGRVLVEHGAQKTSSQMTNQNLTATKEARMYTQPMLEIYADDVKCAHGSTVGQLNDAALFYMRQRGISLKEAKLLLQNAFINEVIDHMQLEPLRDRLHYLVEKRFRGELNKCSGCKLCK